MTGPLHAPQNCSCIYTNLIGYVGTIIKMSDCHFDFYKLYWIKKTLCKDAIGREISDI